MPLRDAGERERLSGVFHDNTTTNRGIEDPPIGAIFTDGEGKRGGSPPLFLCQALLKIR